MASASADSLSAAALCEALLRQSPGCAWLLNPGHEFHSVYGAAPRAFGRPDAELATLKFAELFAPPVRPSWTGRAARAFAGETVSASGRFGEMAPLYSITLFPVRLPEGRIAFVGGLAHEMAERDLMLRAWQAFEADRVRLSQLLHDQVGPHLSAAGLQLDLLRMDLAENTVPAAQRAGEIQALLETVIGLLRDFSHELNPVPARVGLRAALDQLAGRLRTTFKGNVRVLAHATAQPPPEAAAALYYIAREAAGYAASHAGCSTIEILLKSLRSGPALEIRDNGRGFDAAQGALPGQELGILIMQHHADQAGIELQIESTPGKGTVVRALWPNRVNGRAS